MRCRWVLLFVLPLLFACQVLFPSSASAGLGPFRIPALGAGEFFRTVPAFASPFTDSMPGRVELGMDVRWLNTWVYHVESDRSVDWVDFDDTDELKHGSFLFDVETLAFVPSVLYRVGDRVTLGFEIPVAIQGGGVLDGFIEGFHSMVGVGQHNRDDWSRDSSHYITVDRNDVAHDKSDELNRVITGDVQLSASMLVSQWPMLTARAIVKLPTSRIYDSQENSGTDLTLQGIWSWQWGAVSGYHGVGGTVYTRDGDDNLDLERFRFSTMNSLEYMPSETFSWVVSLNHASAVADYPELDEPVVELTMGFKKIVGPGVLEFGIIENLFFFDNSPDAGLQLGYTLKLL
ncbi:Protein of unknown function [Desulfoluna spongiiphila]|uniref:DUF3187 family protein n=1 Tax=Desulfoluna spongiiphila TaxID=419481 RepID=A0A1G5CXN7_9BACT|nr:DUF3187 family protein [Desulfoluna spongiiphila]SCY07205.1 Protein of unknown function [Desulfoluna spongiiphila]